MRKELPKTYDPSSFEKRIYSAWREGGCFTPEIDKTKPHYSIVMPPPNITGQLHMGHALDNTLQDILTRYKRMSGFCTLWLPGTDHASIATEAKIVEAMRKEGITKEDLGRDGFLERAWAWKEQYGGRIVEQLKILGSSCDWSRERFTMDEGCSEAVQDVFMRLYEKGLIYRGNRMVNWCTTCKTSISDAEVEYEDQNGNFYHLLYPVKETGEMLELATTRPETMLGDTAVAINAEDPRYAHLHGCHVILPLINKEIPIVCDEHADMTKGTGVVKITPAHDPNDYEVGARHDLPLVRVFTYDGRMTGADDRAAWQDSVERGIAAVGEPEVLDCGKYAGMTTVEARKAILADLEAAGLLKSVEPLTHNVGTCYRCHHVIEPMISKQWFVKMEPLAKPAIDAVRDGRIKFVPDRFSKNYFHWMENIRDWCISRQLWWGHRIPAYYCDDCGEMVVSREAATVCPKCGGKMTQDPDTLDTWFSSALWPFSTMGWPENTEDLKYFYPTNTLVTGYDIITFWVSRMIFSGLEYTGEIPFDTVLIHGLVRDSQGRKMSKSLGNGIDPLEVIDKYGADALRFALANGNSPGNDMRYSDEKLEAARNFANKLWNAARFILMNLETDDITLPDASELAPEDKWILTKLAEISESVATNINKYEIGVALAELYNFVWDVFCDWYIEMSKARLNAKGTKENLVAQRTITYVFIETLKLLHPYMPFITEEIYQAMPHAEGSMIMLEKFPENKAELNFPVEAAQVEKLIAVIRGIRGRRAEMNVPPKTRTALYIITNDKDAFGEANHVFLERLAGAESVALVDEAPEGDCVSIVTDSATVYIPLNQLVDMAAEKERLEGELKKMDSEIARAEGKLNNQGFVAKAPEAVVAAEREKLEKLRATKQAIIEAIAKIG